MGLKAWLYFGFTSILAAAFASVIVYYFRARRKDRVEEPKYRMLDDDED